ncbi:MAG: DNA-binding protein WhiA [Defluviitaleaceae bacterium]|nr:DNA-binding protein WhiA [Defluviitaleaceae bacterium]
MKPENFTNKVKLEISEQLGAENFPQKYLAEAFVKNGYITDPTKAYHLEFVFKDVAEAQKISETLKALGIKAKVIQRKNYYITYVKDGEHIADFLGIVVAHNALMDFYNIRILKDISGKVNRKVNLETANINKTISAALVQEEDIKFILAQSKNVLSPQLKELALNRINNMDATLKELGEMFTPPLSKSCVNHRLRKIKQVAEQIRKTK